MDRRSLIRLSSLLPIGIFSSRFLGAPSISLPSAIDVRQRAETLHLLAANIRTPADASAFVSFVANLFQHDAPSALLSPDLRERVAHAEYLSATDTRQLIPEQRLADAWNNFVAVIQAPAERHVETQELHDLRYALFSTATVFWNSGNRSLWTTPSIYAADTNGSLKAGCRAIESIRLLWDLANKPENLTAARTRIASGTPASEMFPMQKNTRTTGSGAISFSIRPADPLEAAEREFVRQHGMIAFTKVVLQLVLRAIDPD